MDDQVESLTVPEVDNYINELELAAACLRLSARLKAGRRGGGVLRRPVHNFQISFELFGVL